MNFLVTLLACGQVYGIDKSSMFSRQHVNQDFFNFIMVLEICYNCLWAESYCLIGSLNFSFSHFGCAWILNVHFLRRSSRLLGYWLSLFHDWGYSLIRSCKRLFYTTAQLLILLIRMITTCGMAYNIFSCFIC